MGTPPQLFLSPSSPVIAVMHREKGPMRRLVLQKIERWVAKLRKWGAWQHFRVHGTNPDVS
jgi:hypothetical protein